MRARTLLAVLGLLAAAPSQAGVPPGLFRGPLPDVPLKTQDGREVRFYRDLVQGRAVVVSFMYATCRGTCPVTTERLAAMQRILRKKAGREVLILSLTLDPERDTPQILRAFARTHGAGPGWFFLTGKPEDLEELRRRLGFTDPDPKVDADRTQHANLIAFGNDRTGRWAAVPAGISPEQIAEAVLRVTADPPGGR
jgi:protein SCO1/2